MSLPNYRNSYSRVFIVYADAPDFLDCTQSVKIAVPLGRKIWTSPKYHTKRMKLYKEEGIEVDKNNKIKNFEEILFEFK